MNDKQIRLVIGSLLHDFGKLLFKESANHSNNGYDELCRLDSLKNEADILNCIKYHHSYMIRKSSPENSSICYITYIADSIASSADRGDEEDKGYVKNTACESVFNILNGNCGKSVYRPTVMSDSDINYPTEENIVFPDSFYFKVTDNITYSLKNAVLSSEYINYLLQVLKTNLSFIPSSGETGEPNDISLYDHVKLTAALASCVQQYLDENGISDYKAALFDGAEEFYSKKVFRLYSLDMSGIQDFIYNISSKSALKGLRARSFYLEILLEDIVDELLDRLSLCRANVLYTGGGHTYIIMPATETAGQCIADFEKELSRWFVDTFGTALFAAAGYADCSANELRNIPDGSYKDIFRKISSQLSEKKLNRYSADTIRALNRTAETFDGSRECVICHRSDTLSADDECLICSGLKKLSDSVIGGNDSIFAVVGETAAANSVPLPFGCSLAAYPKDKLPARCVRAYSKSFASQGTRLFVGDYAVERDFSALVEKSRGIERLAVIRADVDNLGQAFVNGFSQTGNGKYETLSRTSAFSSKLSEFFKLNINSILSGGEFSLFDDREKNSPRNAVIVYSGGDDLFVVGGWDDIIGFGVDMYKALKKYSQGTLTLSAGIGIFPAKYPIYNMAEQTGRLEDVSKHWGNGSKNAVTLFDESCTYSWEELITDVIGEKLQTLREYIDNNSAHSKALLYNMLTLIRNRERENRLNIARFAYLIARLKPDSKKCKPEETERYNSFAKDMYSWIQDSEECRKLVTAIYIYIYMNRESEEQADG